MSQNVKPFTREKLTKKLLMQLPEGVYLVSNCYRSSNQKLKPAFEEKVSPLSERNEQWKRIVEASSNHRLCSVYDTKKDFSDPQYSSKKNY